MVKCLYCKKEYKVITQLHLKSKHKSNIKKYLKKFPDAKIINDYNCQVCDKLVINGQSSRSKYCLTCSEEVNRQNVLHNVRKYNQRKKTFIQRAFKYANQEYGLDVDDDFTRGETRIDKTHSAWDCLPYTGFNNKGTFNEKDLNVGKDGRIKAAKQLEYEINRRKRKNAK